MKKLLVLFITFIYLPSSFSQFGYTEPASNAEGSKYKFTKIASLEATPVESQGNTGTCWSFSTLSFFESEIIRLGTKNPPLLSEMYVARKAYEAKAEKYIRMNGKIQFSEGGLSHDIPFVIKNYGIVPLEVYDGLNYGSETHDHSELFAVYQGAVEGLLKSMNANRRNGKPSTAWKNALNGILNAYFGNDLEEFEFQGKKYTPMSFTKSLGINIDDYVSLTSFTNHPMYEECILQIPDNWSWGKSYNVPLEDLMKISEGALRSGFTLNWDADVSERGFSFHNGLAINPVDKSTIEDKEGVTNGFNEPVDEVEVTAEIRQEAYNDKSTTDDHLMHIVGLFKDQNDTKYFLVKNSWGTGNYPEGYLYVSESYFKMKTITIFVHKDALSDKMKKKLKID